MTEYIYSYFINFSIQLFLMEFIFTGQLVKRSHFIQRAAVIFILYFTFGYELILAVKHIPDSWYPVSIFYYVGLFILSMFILYLLYEVRLKDVLFIGTAGYALQHIGYSFITMLRYILSRLSIDLTYLDIGNRFLFNILFYVIMALIVYKTLVKASVYREQIESVSTKMIILSLSVLGISSVLSVFATALDPDGGAFLNLVCRLYAIVSCSLGLTVQFDISRQNRLETDNVILEQLLHQEKRQHEISKENIMMINMKCHDLKHQIQALEKIDNRAVRSKLIDEMNESIMIYDSTVKSGNDTIDLILTEKSLICQRDKIKFSYIIDGAKLDFMEVPDMYVLFGNALDNAIESVEKEPEEQRIISLNIAQKNQMVIIHLENYCSAELEYEDGLPETTKEDKQYHGFGTRSIQYIVQKYQGFLEIWQDNDKFILEILFNLPDQ